MGSRWSTRKRSEAGGSLEGRVKVGFSLSGPSYPLSHVSEYVPKDSAESEGQNDGRYRIGSAKGESRPSVVTKTGS